MDTRKIPLPCVIHEPELWFPVGTGPAAIDQGELAKEYCHSCPIEAACLQRALDRVEVGIWGGTTEAERHAMIRLNQRSMDSEEARLVVHRALASA